jgi:enamine deaminase RidA (YjgF/YER057c/UK114 family)
MAADLTTALARLAPLHAERLDPAAWAAERASDRPPLGGLSYGVAEDARIAFPGAATTRARVLSPGGPRVDAWRATGPVTDGRCGHVTWRHDGRWLFGAIDLDEDAASHDLAALAHEAYLDVFRTLRETGFVHLQRLWNYLPGINADGNGLERYRHFNAGRQMAFLETGHAAFEGAPAACAIGTSGGPFCVRFLAGAVAPVPVENPRQVSAYHYPSAYGPRSPTFSRAALVRSGEGEVSLLISGTASIVGHASVHVGDVAAQTRETLVNLRAVIDAAHARCSARFALAQLQCVVYVRRAADADLIRSVFEAEVGADSPAARSAVYLEADICRSDLLVEIEAHGTAAGAVTA